MRRLDTADETDRAPSVVERDKQMVTWVCQEGGGGSSVNWVVVQRSRGLNLLDGGRLEDPHEADATRYPSAVRWSSGNRSAPVSQRPRRPRRGRTVLMWLRRFPDLLRTAEIPLVGSGAGVAAGTMKRLAGRSDTSRVKRCWRSISDAAR